VAVSLIAFLPWRATTRYADFRGFHPGYRDLAASGAPDRALVFVRNGDDMGDFGSAFMLNTPDLHGAIFLKDMGAATNAAIAARYPDRRVLVVDGSTAQQKEAGRP